MPDMHVRRSLIVPFLLIAALTLAARVGLAQSSDQSRSVVGRLRAADLERQAELLSDNGDHAGAARKWEEAAAAESNSSQPRSEKAAWSWIDAGDGKEALRAYTARRGPTTGLPVAVMHYLAGEAEQAHDHARTYAAIADYKLLKPEIDAGLADSDRGFPHRLALAHLVLLANQPGRALRILQPLVKAQPKHAGVRHYLADACERLGFYEEADREYAAHAALAPLSARAAITQAQNLEEGKHRDRAHAVLEAARKRFPDDEYVLVALMGLEERLGHGERVAALLRQALEPPLAAPYGPPAMTHQAGSQALIRMGRWADREAVSAELMRRWPLNYPARRDRLRALVLLGRVEEALRVIDVVSRAAPAPGQPGPGPIREVEGAPLWLLYLAAGEKEQAWTALPPTQPGQYFPSFWLPEADSIRAWLAPAGPERETLLENSARRLPPAMFPNPGYGPPFPPDVPLKLWQMVAARYPDCFPAEVFTAVWLSRSGNRDGAAALLRKAIAGMPDWALPRILLAQYYRGTGDTRRATAEESRVYDLLPGYNPNSYSAASQPVDAALVAERKIFRTALALARDGKWEETAAQLAGIKTHGMRPAAARLLGAVRLLQGTAQAVEESMGGFAGLSSSGGRSFYGLFPPQGEMPQAGRRAAEYGPGEAHLLLSMTLLSPTYSDGRAEASRPEILDMLLHDAAEKAPRDPRMRTSLGIWLLRSAEYWPEGAPEKTDPKRVRHGRELLEAILLERPGNAAALMGLGREEEALEKNPDDAQLSTEMAAASRNPELRLRALQGLRRFYPRSPTHMERLWQVYRERGERDRALAEARAMQALPLPNEGESPVQVQSARSRGLLLEGILHVERGQWREAQTAFDALVRQPGGARQMLGYTGDLWAVLARLATEESPEVAPLLLRSLAEDADSTLARLLLGWLCGKDEGGRMEDEGDPSNPQSAIRNPQSLHPSGLERWRYLTAVSLQAPAARTIGTPTVDLMAPLEGVLRRTPDCWPARLFLGIGRLSASGAGGGGGVRQARIELNRAASQAPEWSGPAAYLAGRGDRDGYFASEARRLRRRERDLLRQLAAEARLPLQAPFHVAWRMAGYGSQLPAGDERDLFRFMDSSLVRCSPFNGAEVDRTRLDYSNQPPLLARDLVLTVQQGVVAAYGREDLGLRWATPFPASTSGYYNLLAAVDGEYGAWLTEDGQVHCLRLSDGALAWSVKLDGRPSAPPLLAGEYCLVGLRDGTFRRIKRVDGAVLPAVPVPSPADPRWQPEPKPAGEAAAAPTAPAKGVIRNWLAVKDRLYASIHLPDQDYGKRLEACWKVGAMEPLWVTNTGKEGQTRIFHGPAGLVVAPHYGDWVLVLDSEKGSVASSIQLAEMGSGHSVQAVVADTLVARLSNGKMGAFRLPDGKRVWEGNLQGYYEGSVRCGELLLVNNGSQGLIALAGGEQPQPPPLPAPVRRPVPGVQQVKPQGRTKAAPAAPRPARRGKRAPGGR
jgi:putative pyrroloquinoline-quinone binding quinoprotein